jgi:hypothetical protein
MDGTNIISVNVANFVSITIMAAVGLFVANLALRTAKAKMSAQGG